MSYILNLSCPDRPGIVAAVSTFLSRAGMNIKESHQFGDSDSARFFMRIDFATCGTASRTDDDAGRSDLMSLRTGFNTIAAQFDMNWEIYDSAVHPRVLILVSRFDHCLVDLIYRTERDNLHMDIVGVASNHESADEWVSRAGLLWHYWGDVGSDKGHNRVSRDLKLAELAASQSVELIILARYMQILSSDFIDGFSGQIINIHHSFLPSFKGAVPYSRAYERGVKMIGATAHFVTAALDEGPIITQGVGDVRHDMGVDALVNVGRDIERRVLAEAVRLYTERRVLINNTKTVVFA